MSEETPAHHEPFRDQSAYLNTFRADQRMTGPDRDDPTSPASGSVLGHPDPSLPPAERLVHAMAEIRADLDTMASMLPRLRGRLSVEETALRLYMRAVEIDDFRLLLDLHTLASRDEQLVAEWFGLRCDIKVKILQLHEMQQEIEGAKYGPDGPKIELSRTK